MARLVQTLADALDDRGRDAGNEYADGTIHHLFGLIAEELLRARVLLDEMAVGIRDDHGIVHAAQQLAEQRPVVFHRHYGTGHLVNTPLAWVACIIA